MPCHGFLCLSHCQPLKPITEHFIAMIKQTFVASNINTLLHKPPLFTNQFCQAHPTDEFLVEACLQQWI